MIAVASLFAGNSALQLPTREVILRVAGGCIAQKIKYPLITFIVNNYAARSFAVFKLPGLYNYTCLVTWEVRAGGTGNFSSVREEVKDQWEARSFHGSLRAGLVQVSHSSGRYHAITAATADTTSAISVSISEGAVFFSRCAAVRAFNLPAPFSGPNEITSRAQ